MTTNTETAWTCKRCGKPLRADEPQCPECGPVERMKHVGLGVQIGQVVNVAGRVEDPSLPRKKNPRLRFRIGRKVNRDTGEFVAFDWRMDRRLDRYWEKVRDARGRFVHWVDHKLSRHRGHGSARRPPKP